MTFRFDLWYGLSICLLLWQETVTTAAANLLYDESDTESSEEEEDQSVFCGDVCTKMYWKDLPNFRLTAENKMLTRGWYILNPDEKREIIDVWSQSSLYQIWEIFFCKSNDWNLSCYGFESKTLWLFLHTEHSETPLWLVGRWRSTTKTGNGLTRWPQWIRHETCINLRLITGMHRTRSIGWSIVLTDQERWVWV